MLLSAREKPAPRLSHEQSDFTASLPSPWVLGKGILGGLRFPQPLGGGEALWLGYVTATGATKPSSAT